MPFTIKLTSDELQTPRNLADDFNDESMAIGDDAAFTIVVEDSEESQFRPIKSSPGDIRSFLQTKLAALGVNPALINAIIVKGQAIAASGIGHAMRYLRDEKGFDFNRSDIRHRLIVKVNADGSVSLLVRTSMADRFGLNDQAENDGASVTCTYYDCEGGDHDLSFTTQAELALEQQASEEDAEIVVYHYSQLDITVDSAPLAARNDLWFVDEDDDEFVLDVELEFDDTESEEEDDHGYSATTQGEREESEEEYEQDYSATTQEEEFEAENAETRAMPVAGSLGREGTVTPGGSSVAPIAAASSFQAFQQMMAVSSTASHGGHTSPRITPRDNSGESASTRRRAPSPHPRQRVADIPVANRDDFSGRSATSSAADEVSATHGQPEATVSHHRPRAGDSVVSAGLRARKRKSTKGLRKLQSRTAEEQAAADQLQREQAAQRRAQAASHDDGDEQDRLMAPSTHAPFDDGSGCCRIA